MQFSTFAAFALYFSLLLGIGYTASRKQASSAGMITGTRSLNYWVTAISAHASDMSSWLFMGLPAAFFLSGMPQIWTGIGLVAFMFLNWHFVAPRLRLETEKHQTFTLAGYFGCRFHSPSGSIHLAGALLSLVYITVYVTAGFIGLGVLFESLFAVPYEGGVLFAIVIVVIYISLGGYVGVAWSDFFQGLFLLAVILLVPFLAWQHTGGVEVIATLMEERQISTSFFADHTFTGIASLTLILLGWGLGYFGQPHILNKFMGIRKPEELRKAKFVGTTWQVLSLGASLVIGWVAIGYFPQGVADPETLFVRMVQDLFNPFVGSFVLCGILAATLSTIDSQILVLAAILTEDFYEKTFHKHATEKGRLLVSRLSIFLIALLACVIALLRPSQIFTLVQYAWSGLGASFGPLVLWSLYSPSITRYGALAGMLSGGVITGIWPWLVRGSAWEGSPELVPGFFLSALLIPCVSRWTRSWKNQLDNR